MIEPEEHRWPQGSWLGCRRCADPFAAVVGAYLLLRMRKIELLHDWTRNLMEIFLSFPDAVVIRAWHLIYRRGDEAEALSPCRAAILENLNYARIAVPWAQARRVKPRRNERALPSAR